MGVTRWLPLTHTRAMAARILVAVMAVVLVLAGCAAPGPTVRSTVVPFTKVDLPAGAVPDAIAAAGDDLLVGVRKAGAPGLIRESPAGVSSEIPVAPSSPYGRTAVWSSIAADGHRILAIGGDRGGAHGNVRWSVWTGTDAGVAEHTQAFSTFGGWGAGDLIDAVLLPSGSALVGSWQSDSVGLDVTAWTPSGDTWMRQNTAGTPLQSTPSALGFATSATDAGSGIVVAGWQFVTGPASGAVPVVWRSAAGISGWTRTLLPEDGTSGAAVTARCWGLACAVSGRVDGRLALWRTAGDAWTRVMGLPPIPIGDQDPVPAPLDIGGQLTQIVPDQGRIEIIHLGPTGPTVDVVAGPQGPVSSAVHIGRQVYLLAGPAGGTRSLWRAAIG